MSYLEEFYKAYDEEGRLLSRHGQVEYLTTMKYIYECTGSNKNLKILEVGAGTGHYSVTLAKEGYDVTAVELVEHNLEVLRSKLGGSEKLRAMLGNALDLSALRDEEFDLTMLLGPMYHLFTEEDKLLAMKEAVRVTKKGGLILVAYCMNEPTIIQHVFLNGNLNRVLENDMLTPEWHCKSEPEEIFELVRTEDIEKINSAFPVERIKFIAADGMAHYFKDAVDAMDDFTFEKFMEYHFVTCERLDIIGTSNHTLDILRKI